MTQTKKQAGLFGLLLVLDQLSKWWIEQHLPFYRNTVIDGLFDIVQAHNTGVAFSLFSGSQNDHLLLGVTLGIALIVAIWWWRERGIPGLTSWLLMLIMAGAAGNILDRIFRGYVVDFLDFYLRIGGHEYHWPAFNVADSCISIGVALLVATSFRKK